MRDLGIGRLPLLLPAVLLSLLLLCPRLALGQLTSRADRAALLQLRSSLGIRSRDWPRKPDPCSQWNGIQCNGNGRVVGINISGFRRTRISALNPQFSVDALANLTSLTAFNASRFLLPGRIPDLFGQQLVSLEVLDLRSCSVIGVVPSSLGGLTNLSVLYLAGNNLTGAIPPIFGRLFRLSALNLSGNTLNGSFPPSFASLKNLSTLDISSNSLSGSIPLGIGTLSRLQYLNLSRNNLSGVIPPQLGDLRSLVDLDLSFNGLSSSVPPDLRGLRSLGRMLLGDNQLSGSLPSNLFPNPSQLQVLVLRNNALGGALPNSLWSLPGLITVDISGNNFTGLLPDRGLNSNATTAALNMSQNSFYGNITDVLRRFGPMDLSGNYFEGKVPDFVRLNSSLNNNCLQSVLNQRTLEDCSSFYTRAGLVFDNFGRTNSTSPPAPQPSKKSNRKLYILIGVLGGSGILVLLLLLCGLLFICTRKRGSPNQRGVGVGPVPSTSPAPSGQPANIARVGDSYTYQQLLEATNEFNDASLIKHGHSGDLFKGVLEGGIPVVVKKIDLQAMKKESYPIELDFFSKVTHGRFVPFLGHCLENENEKFLVYKYMPNEDLASSLYKKGSSDDDSLQSLDWIKRLKIAVGAAEGLTYLHHECYPPLVHRDVQASSILLDDKFEVRLGSLSEVCAQEGDTHHSRISRLLRLPQSSDQGSSDSTNANCAYDVFCFGKVLLELVTGKLDLSASPDAEIKEWLDQTLPYINIYDKELVTKIVDPLLIVDEDLLEEVWAMAIVARSCLNPKPTRRPPMRYILKALENPLKIIREDNNSGSGRLRATSSRGSWNAALFGSWRHSSSDVAVIPAASSATTATRLEAAGATGSFKQSGTTGSHSQGSGPNNGSSSHRRHSKDIFPEPPDVQDVE
ncbi:hypothetical protein CDL15_Pgr019305 [Punica granatum]|uniref:Protein kinase domain-containing protein n=1 Tax=Punica granatum TaxID=22663 RepID=A0A218XR22_PUNGR|nr:hypothetical protein CDL15_Pgr019305 [Punica granatum]